LRFNFSRFIYLPVNCALLVRALMSFLEERKKMTRSLYLRRDFSDALMIMMGSDE
jgi:hypothetical protein